MLWVGPVILNFTGISNEVFDFRLATDLWIFSWLMGKTVFAGLFRKHTLDLAESVNDPDAL